MNITIKPIGLQKGLTPDGNLDLYNIGAPGNACDGTTIAVPAGAPMAAVLEKAAETVRAFA